MWPAYAKRGRELGEVLRIYRDEALPLHIRLHDQRSVRHERHKSTISSEPLARPIRVQRQGSIGQGSKRR
jgi:hypothetical protein